MKIRNPYRYRGACACLLTCCALLTLAACGGGEDDAAMDANRETGTDARAGAVTADLPLPTPADTAAVPVPAADVEPAPEPAPATVPQPAPEPAPEPTPPPPAAVAPAGDFALQLGSFRQSQRAAALATRLREAGHAATIEMAEVDGTAWHRVMLDGFADRAEAGRVGEELRTRLGIDYLIRRRD